MLKGLAPPAARGRISQPLVPSAAREREAVEMLLHQVRIQTSSRECLVPPVARSSRVRLAPPAARGMSSCMYPALQAKRALPRRHQGARCEVKRPVLHRKESVGLKK